MFTVTILVLASIARLFIALLGDRLGLDRVMALHIVVDLSVFYFVLASLNVS